MNPRSFHGEVAEPRGGEFDSCCFARVARGEPFPPTGGRRPFIRFDQTAADLNHPVGASVSLGLNQRAVGPPRRHGFGLRRRFGIRFTPIR